MSIIKSHVTVTVATPFGPDVRRFDTWDQAERFRQSLSLKVRQTSHITIIP